MLLSVEPPKELNPGEQLGLLTHDISSEEPVVLKLRWIFLMPLLGLPEGCSSSQPCKGALLHPTFLTVCAQEVGRRALKGLVLP